MPTTRTATASRWWATWCCSEGSTAEVRAAMKRLMLLGGGHAHVHVLTEMAREPMPGVQAVLATPYARQIYSGMLPGWVAGHYTLEQCSIALEPLAHAAKVELALSPAVAIDAVERTVT